MKRILPLLLLLALLLSGCGEAEPPAQVAATTLPVYEFTTRLCQGTPITVTRLVTEQVSCLHDYSLKVDQVKAAEAAELVVISGAGLEGFLDGVLDEAKILDASTGISLLTSEDAHDHTHAAHGEAPHGHGEAQDSDHAHSQADGHQHTQDPHIWLSPANAMVMAGNIARGLTLQYPAYAETFSQNESALLSDLEALEAYGREALASISCRDLITFHDGFSYFAQAFDLTILDAVEEEAGREASAQELIHLIEEVEIHRLPAIFAENSGSVSAAGIIARETGCQVYSLDMAMAGDSYLRAMYHNIDTIKEALH